MRTEEEIDAIHAGIREQSPDGLSYDEFKMATLRTADDEGRVYPPPLHGMADFRMVVKMGLIDGLLEYRGTHHTPFLPNHFITEKGRALLAGDGR
jgi:hypothetical protein